MIRQPFTRTIRASKSRAARMTLGRAPFSHKLGSLQCPICDFQGPFLSRRAVTGTRRNAQCPRCGSLERHRIQRLVFERLSSEDRLSGEALLEIAPERFSTGYFRQRFRTVVTGDLLRSDVSARFDLTQIPFGSETFDVVVASHVLEHIPDDKRAIEEIRRIVKPGGLAILPVPIVGERTVEYRSPNRFEDYHVRAPGVDYYDRYRPWFDEVRIFSSAEFDERYQTFLVEDRTVFPSERFPDRQSVDGQRHEDWVAVAMRSETTAT